MINAIRDTDAGRCVLRNESDRISQYGKDSYPLQPKLKTAGY
jgi:hypothetical protein